MTTPDMTCTRGGHDPKENAKLKEKARINSHIRVQFLGFTIT